MLAAEVSMVNLRTQGMKRRLVAGKALHMD